MTDLRSRLHDVVDVPEPAPSRHDRGATAHDDVVVGALTTRVRRRRAVRAGALGTVGALSVAAIAVGGVAVAGRMTPAPAPPATQAPVPDGPSGLTLNCGDRVAQESIRPTDGGMALAALELATGQVPVGSPLDVTVRLENQNDSADGWRTYSWDSQQVVRLAALQDGSVVATGTMTVGAGEYSPGSAMTTSAPVTLSSCATGAGLPQGGYELVASAILANADGSGLVVLSQGMVPFSVDPPPGAIEANQAAAEEAVAALVADAAPPRVDQLVGACGTVLATDPDPLLRLEMTLTGSSFAPGALIEGDAAISTREGLSVLAIGPITAVHAVLVRDGVVVGRGEYDPEYLDLMTFTDATAYPLPAYANAIVCTGPDVAPTGLGLPPGTYQAYGLYEVAIREVQRADGSTEPRSDVVTLVSDPVSVVIEGQAG